jgi:hypothetical protein
MAALNSRKPGAREPDVQPIDLLVNLYELGQRQRLSWLVSTRGRENPPELSLQLHNRYPISSLRPLPGPKPGDIGRLTEIGAKRGFEFPGPMTMDDSQRG